MKYHLDLLNIVYGDFGAKRECADRIIAWLNSKLEYLSIYPQWVNLEPQPALSSMPVFGYDGWEGHHLVPESVTWTGLPQADIVMALWECPTGMIPAAGGLTWWPTSRNGRQCSFVSIPYTVPGDNIRPEKDSGFETGLDSAIAHELKNALVKLVEVRGIPIEDTYPERPPFIDCAQFKIRRQCYEWVLQQLSEEISRTITGGKPPKPPAFDSVDYHDVSGGPIFYHVDYSWNGEKWERQDYFLREG